VPPRASTKHAIVVCNAMLGATGRVVKIREFADPYFPSASPARSHKRLVVP